MDALRTLLELDKTTIECQTKVFEEYYQRFRAQHARMIWEHGSIKHSFYTNEDGLCTLLWPWKILQLWQWTRTIDPKDYRVTN